METETKGMLTSLMLLLAGTVLVKWLTMHETLLTGPHLFAGEVGFGIGYESDFVIVIPPSYLFAGGGLLVLLALLPWYYVEKTALSR